MKYAKELTKQKFKSWHFAGEARKFEDKYGKDAICVWDNSVWVARVTDGRVQYSRRETGL